jgi:hypothetical protein
VVPDFFCFGIGKILPCWGRKGERQNMPKKKIPRWPEKPWPAGGGKVKGKESQSEKFFQICRNYQIGRAL